MVAAGEIDRVLGFLELDADFQAAVARIRPGPLSAEDGCEAYRCYRLYNAALGAFTEDGDLMRQIFGDEMLRIAFFRAFGYRGDLDFAMMPSVALHDLPLLEIGAGAHIGYGVTLGGEEEPYAGVPVSLETIRIGAGCFLNQHAVVEPGARMAEGVCIGIRAMIGRGAELGERVDIGDFSTVGNGAMIGEGAQIGHNAHVGDGAIVDPGLTVADGDAVPPHHRLTAGGLFPRPQSHLAA